MVKYGLRLGKKIIVLEATSVENALDEMNKLLKGPFDLIRTDYRECVVGVKLTTEKAGVSLVQENMGRVVFQVDGKFEKTKKPLLILESIVLEM